MKFETVVYEKLIDIVRRNKSIYIMTLSMSTRISSCRRISGGAGGALAVRVCVLQEALMILQEEDNIVAEPGSIPFLQFNSSSNSDNSNSNSIANTVQHP